MTQVLGIDIGTNGAKIGLFDERGALLDIERRAYPLYYPRPGWAEQNPEEWWQAVRDGVRLVTGRNGVAGRVRAMALSTQGGVTLLLDRSFRPLYPAVSWLDKRAMEIVPLIESRIDQTELYRTCGFPSIGGQTFSQCIWFREKRPEIFSRARYIGSVIDYFHHRLCGRFAIDLSNLALNGFLDVHRKDYAANLLDIAGIDGDHLPAISQSGQVIGSLTPEAASELGLEGEVVVVSGAHDQYCSSIGSGASRSGDCVLSAGTAWVLLATTDRLVYDEYQRLYPGIHAFEGLYGLMSTVLSGGNSLEWFHTNIAADLPLREIDRIAGESDPGAAGLLFVPRLMGKTGTGGLLGIDAVHRREHLARAVLEGVASANQIRLDRMRELGIDVRSIRMIGGGAGSPVWPGIVADTANLPVLLSDQAEAACAGAAALALTGCGLRSGVREAGASMIRSETRVEPRPEAVEIHRRQVERMKAMLKVI